MDAPPQFLLDGSKLRPHAIATRLPLEEEVAPPGLAADEGEAQERERLRFAEPAPRSIRRRKAAELDQAGLVRMERQRKLIQPLTHRLQEASGVGLPLEARDQIVGIAHDYHVARGLAPPPALGPEIEDIVQVDIGKQRRDHRTLPRPLLTDRHRPLFEDARPQPFADQADDALVADPMLDEPNEPFLAHRVERRHHRLPIPKTFRLQWSSPAGGIPS